MSPFEQLVAEALQPPSPVRFTFAGRIMVAVDDIAPRVAAAIEAVVDKLCECDDSIAMEMGGNPSPNCHHDARIIALAALRGTS